MLISWIFGNLFGALSSYYPKNKALSVIEVLGQAVRPIPYYIVAIVLLVVFAFFIPIFPFSGAYPIGTRPNWSLEFIWTYIQHSILPAATLVLVGFGGWFIGMKSLTSNIISEDYVVYAETAGMKESKILSQLHHAQRHAAADHRTGHVAWNGLQRRPHHGGRLWFPGDWQADHGRRSYRNDYSMIMGIAIYSIIGVATAVFLMDLIYPLFDPRVRYQ